MTEVRYGSSPYVSCPRPQRASPIMFMFRVHTDRPWYVSSFFVFLSNVFFALISSLTAVKMLNNKASSKDAAIPMHEGNTVAKPLRPAPWSPSDHHANCGMPSLGIAGDVLIINCVFSSNVSLLHKSAAL